jgi:hypothetical protein
MIEEKRHGIEMSIDTHDYLNAFEAELESGGHLLDLIVGGNGTSNLHAQFSNEATFIRDADIRHTHALRDKATNIPVYYRLGTDWRVDESTPYPVIIAGSGRAGYNELVAGNYQVTEVAEGKYVTAIICAVNDTSRPYVSIMGQEYGSETAAKVGVQDEVKILKEDMPSEKFVFLAALVLESSSSFSNDVKSAIVPVEGSDYIDLREPLCCNLGIVDYIANDIFVAKNYQYYLNESITVDGSVTIDGSLVVS